MPNPSFAPAPMLTCQGLEFDNGFKAKFLCGLDEAGRGPLVGPVIAGCVHIPPEALAKAPELLTLQDSKKLSKSRREVLFDLVTRFCAYGVGQAGIEEIDDINILHASMNAMTRAWHDMMARRGVTQAHLSAFSPDLALIDGNRVPKDMPIAARAIVKGDAKSLCIAAASVVAKVTRDRLLEEIGRQYPAYQWHKNSGYGTADHLDAIAKYGATPHHRMSFAPLKNME